MGLYSCLTAKVASGGPDPDTILSYCSGVPKNITTSENRAHKAGPTARYLQRS